MKAAVRLPAILQALQPHKRLLVKQNVLTTTSHQALPTSGVGRACMGQLAGISACAPFPCGDWGVWVCGGGFYPSFSAPSPCLETIQVFLADTAFAVGWSIH